MERIHKGSRWKYENHLLVSEHPYCNLKVLSKRIYQHQSHGIMQSYILTLSKLTQQKDFSHYCQPAVYKMKDQSKSEDETQLKLSPASLSLMHIPKQIRLGPGPHLDANIHSDSTICVLPHFRNIFIRGVSVGSRETRGWTHKPQKWCPKGKWMVNM